MTQPSRGPHRAAQLAGVAMAVALLTGGVALVPRLVSAPGTAGAAPEPSASSATPVTSETPSAPASVPPSATPTGSASAVPAPPSTAAASPSTSVAATVDTASRALRTAARRLLPDADFGAVAVGFDGGTRILRPFQVVDNDHGYFVAFAQVRLGSGADGLFTLIMWPGAGSWKAPTMECDRAAGPGHECETRTGAGGERFVVERGRWQDSDVTEFQVKVARPNGSLLVAKVNDEAGEGGPTPAPGATAGPGPTGPPMSTDQLIALLLTPGLDVPTSRTQPS